MSRFAFGPRQSGYLFPALTVTAPAAAKVDVQAHIAAIRYVDGVAVVDLVIPPHDAAAVNCPIKAHAVFSRDEPKDTDDPEAWTKADGHFVGAIDVPANGGSGVGVSISVNPPLDLDRTVDYCCQVVLEFAA